MVGTEKRLYKSMNKDHPEGKIVTRLESQSDTIKLARHFAKREISMPEKVLGVLGFVIFYGIAIGMLLYLLYGVITRM